MNRAFLKFYTDSTRYNLAFSILVLMVSGPIAGIVSLSTFGLVIGLMCYKQFHGHQYYFYYNLGMTKQRLIIKSLIINMIITLPIILLTY